MFYWENDHSILYTFSEDKYCFKPLYSTQKLIFSWYVCATITIYHILGDLQLIEIYFSQFWGLKSPRSGHQHWCWAARGQKVFKKCNSGSGHPLKTTVLVLWTNNAFVTAVTTSVIETVLLGSWKWDHRENKINRIYPPLWVLEDLFNSSKARMKAFLQEHYIFLLWCHSQILGCIELRPEIMDEKKW